MDIPKVDKSVPIPSAKSGSGKWLIVLESLEVGDSFAVPSEEGRCLYTVCARWNTRRPQFSGRSFRVRVRLEDGVHVRRVWRVA